MINTINALYVHIFHVAAINGRMADTVSNSSLDVSDIDLLSDAYSDKEVIRTKTFLFVADLARNGPRFHGKKTRLYMWNLIIVISHSFIDLANDFIHFIFVQVAVFYALPVLQLVIVYQNVCNATIFFSSCVHTGPYVLHWNLGLW